LRLGYGKDGPGFEIPSDARDLSLLQNVQTGSEALSAPYSMDNRVLLKKWPGLEVEHSIP
jgi:hypothetical protein